MYSVTSEHTFKLLSHDLHSTERVRLAFYLFISDNKSHEKTETHIDFLAKYILPP